MKLKIQINKSSPIPIYYQLREQLSLLINDGTYPVGSQLPPELEISQALSISRGTVRQAINMLVTEGRLERIQGSGTFVSDSSRATLNLVTQFSSFVEEMREQNLPFTSQVLSKQIIRAEGRLVDKLRIEPGESVIYLERLGTLDKKPFVLSFTYLPQSLCPDLLEKELNEKALYDVLEQDYGHRLKRATRTIEASIADEYEASLLDIPVGNPIHFVHSLAFLDNDQPIEYSRLRFRGNRSRITFEVSRPTH